MLSSLPTEWKLQLVQGGGRYIVHVILPFGTYCKHEWMPEEEEFVAYCSATRIKFVRAKDEKSRR